MASSSAADLRRRLEPRLPAVEARDVAEFASIRAAAGELQRAQQVTRQRNEVIGGDREIGERQPLLGLEPQLRRRRRDAAVERGDQRLSAVPEFADVEILDFGIHLRRCRDGRAAERHHLAGRLDAAVDIPDLRRLDVHAADQHHIGPVEIGAARPRDVLVDEPHLPLRRHIGRDQQQPLRRHESAHVVHQTIGVRKRAERRRVSREHAENSACVAGRQRETQRDPLRCALLRSAPSMDVARNPVTAIKSTNSSTAFALRTGHF